MSSSLNTLTATSDIKTSPSLQTLEVDPAIESQVVDAISAMTAQAWECVPDDVKNRVNSLNDAYTKTLSLIQSCGEISDQHIPVGTVLIGEENLMANLQQPTEALRGALKVLDGKTKKLTVVVDALSRASESINDYGSRDFSKSGYTLSMCREYVTQQFEETAKVLRPSLASDMKAVLDAAGSVGIPSILEPVTKSQVEQSLIHEVEKEVERLLHVRESDVPDDVRAWEKRFGQEDEAAALREKMRGAKNTFEHEKGQSLPRSAKLDDGRFQIALNLGRADDHLRSLTQALTPTESIAPNVRDKSVDHQRNETLYYFRRAQEAHAKEVAAEAEVFYLTQEEVRNAVIKGLAGTQSQTQ